MKRSALVIVLCIGSWSFAGPTTQPAAEVPALIRQLGDDDFQKREAASQSLRQIGKDALPALRQAQTDPNPEVQSRADSLIKEIEEPPAPKPLRDDGMLVFPGGNVRMQLQMGVNGMAGGNRTMMVVENGKRTSIVENADGIKMTLTEPDKDGKPVERTVEAKNADELKKLDPDAWATYDRLMGQNAGRMMDFQLGVPEFRLDLGDDIQKRLAEVDRQLAQQMKQLQVMRGARLGGLRMKGFDLTTGTEIDALGGTFEEADGALRAQLGASVVVTSVNAESRAEKIGLKENDLIQKVNDKPVATPDDIEQALDGVEHVTMTILRAGKPMVLTEK